MGAIANLPPLILHPFGGGGSTDELLEGSKASLALQGLMDSAEKESELFRRIMLGRYQEIRMLLFLGKDIFRWMQQCVDFVERSGERERRISEQSFAALIVEDPPAAVQAKLEKWGVSDRRAVFSRAIGINSLFSSPPPVETLSPMFLKHYHRYADHAYICFQHLKPFPVLDPHRFDFQLYASEEYARLLSDQWEHA
jgi:hypothetical protein